MQAVLDYLLQITSEFFSEVWLLITSASYTDLFDILLVAFLLFYAFTFIRDKRAGKLIIGVFILLLLEVLAYASELSTVKFLLGNFFEVGMIALIILFQPELRSALEKVGSEPLKGLKKIGDKNGAQRVTAMIGDICDSACQMSKEKTGALIVIERKTKLGEYISSGTVVNADVSSPMLENIFFKNAPLHDGALIIRGTRIHAAGCFLPLSDNDDFKDLGTRHHAAVGVTEVSDAIVIVVSEQTGNISVAIDGKLRRNLDYVKLKSFLTSLLIETDSAEKSKKNGKKGKKKKKQSAEQTVSAVSGGKDGTQDGE